MRPSCTTGSAAHWGAVGVTSVKGRVSPEVRNAGGNIPGKLGAGRPQEGKSRERLVRKQKVCRPLTNPVRVPRWLSGKESACQNKQGAKTAPSISGAGKTGELRAEE